jgi:hypothetical protein
VGQQPGTDDAPITASYREFVGIQGEMGSMKPADADVQNPRP